MFLLYNKFIIIAINALISQMVTFWIKWRSVLKSSYLKKIFFFSSPTGVESISDLPEYRFGSCMGSAPVGQLRKFSFWVIRLVNSHKLTFGFCCAWYVLWKLGRRLNTPIVPNPRFNPYKGITRTPCIYIRILSENASSVKVNVLRVSSWVILKIFLILIPWFWRLSACPELCCDWSVHNWPVRIKST